MRGIIALMEEHGDWQGSPSDLLEAITQVYHSQLETYGATRFGVELDRLAGMIYDNDGVMIARKKVVGRKIITITREDSDSL